jgi:Glyoxalase-like domain
MPTRLVHLVVDAADPPALARFWADALGWVIGDVADDEVDVWPEGYSYPDPVALPLVFVPVPEPKQVKNRVHLDLIPDTTREEEVARLVSLGATQREDHRRPDGSGWVMLTDPEGNEFCVERSLAERHP